MRSGVDRSGRCGPRCAQGHIRVRLPRKNATDRRRDIGGRQSGGCYLVEERLEQVMVAAIDDRHVGGHMSQLHRSRKAAETGADDNDMGPRRAGRRLVVPNYLQAVDNAIHRLLPPSDARLAPPSAIIARANATTAKPAPSVKCSATTPITGGPSRKPLYPAVDTAAIASSGNTLGILPAVLNRIGTAFASPRPTAAKPISAVIGLPSQRPAAARAATPDPAARTVGPPQRRTTRSPRKRPAAMASENAAKPSAANPALAAKLSLIYTAAQSPIAPSASKLQSTSIPRALSGPRGSRKPVRTVGSVVGSSNAIAPKVGRSRPATVATKCKAGLTPTLIASAAAAAPARPPMLNSP